MYVIDKVVAQILLQKDSEDPDPASALAEIDVQRWIAELTEVLDKTAASEDKYRKQLEKAKRLDKELDEEKKKSSRWKSWSIQLPRDTYSKTPLLFLRGKCKCFRTEIPSSTSGEYELK